MNARQNDPEKNREQLGCSIKCLNRSSQLFFLAFFINGIWNAVIASRTISDFYIFIAGDLNFKILIALSVLSFAVIIIFFFLIAMLYFLGFAFKFHTCLATLTVMTVVTAMMLMCFDIYLARPSNVNNYKKKTKTLLQEDPSNINLTQWKEFVKCETYDSCLPKVDTYFDLNTLGQLIVSATVLVLICIGISGIVYASCRMKYIQRPQESDDAAAVP